MIPTISQAASHRGDRTVLPNGRRVKIVATLGPAVTGRDNLGQMIDAGMDVARINCAHGTREERARMIEDLRAAADERNLQIPILMDLRGLKLRTGPLEGSNAVPLARGGKINVFPTQVPTTREQFGVNYPKLLDVVVPGARLLVADGLIELLVEEVREESAVCSIGRGGPLASGQGVTIPNINMQDATITDNDRVDIEFAARHGVEFLGLSFLSSADDVRGARELAASFGARPGLVAKIERPLALEQIEPIARAADVVMVARGDLGVQLPPERVPRAQKHIIRVCNELGTPVITATQMLESMIMQPVPTRAETSDVANAVLDGTDAVMLSAETATGRYPFESISMMHRIICDVESDGPIRTVASHEANPLDNTEQKVAAALGRAARALSDATPIDVVVVFTLSGASARLVARNRPWAPVIAVTTDPFVARQLGMVWGVRAMVLPLVHDLEQLFDDTARALLREEMVSPGAEGLFIGSVPIFSYSGQTNLLHVRRIGG
jgi:pyruvate kinase